LDLPDRLRGAKRYFPGKGREPNPKTARQQMCAEIDFRSIARLDAMH
jgi:hypothetical protein